MSSLFSNPKKPAAVSIRVEGMASDSCVERVEKAIRATPGVVSASVNLATNRAEVTFSGVPDIAAVIAAIGVAGYKCMVENYGVITEPRMLPLGPLATELAIMTIGFCYIMIVYCLYSAAWAVNGGRVPRGAYGRRLSALEPLRPSRLLDTLLPGHRSQNVTRWEAALFSLSSGLFVAASMAPLLRLSESAECGRGIRLAGPAGMHARGSAAP